MGCSSAMVQYYIPKRRLRVLQSYGVLGGSYIKAASFNVSIWTRRVASHTNHIADNNGISIIQDSVTSGARIHSFIQQVCYVRDMTTHAVS